MTDTVLEAQNISKEFGGLRAVDDVSISVPAAAITALIGPNGAGKTTFFNCVNGSFEPTGGRVTLNGVDVTSWDVGSRARAGMARTFQRLEVFLAMTVRQNLLVAAEARSRGWVADLLGRPPADGSDQLVERALDDLDLVGVADQPAGTMSTGTLRRLEVARALCTEPVVLMLDEPASGLNVEETEAFGRLLVRLAENGLAILLIEHDMKLVTDVSDWVVVLEQGAQIAEGTSAEILDDPLVRTAYLGQPAEGGSQ